MTRILGLAPSSKGFLSLIPQIAAFDRYFEGSFPLGFASEGEEWLPAFDICENDKEYLIEGEIPGMDSKNIDISLDEGVLSIKGEKKREKEEKDENYHIIERRYGSFQRKFILPEDVVADKLDATYKNGILKLTLPKTEKVEAKKIKVKDNA